MSFSLFSARRSLKIVLCVGLLIAACSRENPSPNGTIRGAMPPVAGVVSATSVTATAADGTVYTVTPDPQTGAFTFFSVPPGTYTLKFVTTATAPDKFPVWVPVKVTAGTTVMPQIPPITHDGIGRGTLRWVLDGKPYTARAFIKVYGEGKYFTLWGRSENFSPTSDVKEVVLVLPEQTENGPLFVGVGTYPLGGSGRVTAFGQSTVYPTNDPVINWNYQSTYAATPTGTAHALRCGAGSGSWHLRV